jgi:PAS domain S-box-containing protein
MQAPLQIGGSLRAQSRLFQWSLLILFAALSLVSFFQARFLLLSSATGTALTGSMTQTLQERLSGVSAGIASYLQTHDAASLRRIQTDGKELSRLLAEYKNPRIEKAHEQIREATLNLLAVDQELLGQRRILNETKQALKSLLTDVIGPSIKSNQLNAESRSRAVRAALREVGRLSEDRGPGIDLGENRARFRRAIVTYQELSRTRRTSQWAQQATTSYDRAQAAIRAYQDSQTKKQLALDRFMQNRGVLTLLLQDDPSKVVMGVRTPSVRHLFASGMAYVFINGLLLLVGTVLVLGIYRQSEKRFVGPIHSILQCVEAAASGDVSRTPDYWARDEVGQLSQAVGRLISVLARSENLVYHLAALVETSGEAIISHTLDGTILSWNKGAQRLYGYSAEEVKGRSIAILCPKEGDSEVMLNLEKIRRGERIQPFETVHEARNGRQVRALVRVSAILDSTRHAIGASFCAQELPDTPLRPSKAIEGSQSI